MKKMYGQSDSDVFTTIFFSQKLSNRTDCEVSQSVETVIVSTITVSSAFCLEKS